MFHLIERVHKKPETLRRRVAFGIAALITLIIFLVWLSTLPAKLRNSKETPDDSKAASPLETFGDSFKGLFEGFSFGVENTPAE